MSRFVCVTEAANNKLVFLNPDHVRSISDIPRGSQITFSDGQPLAVSEGVEAVRAALEGAKS